MILSFVSGFAFVVSEHDLLCIRIVLLGVMSFIEDEKVDLSDVDERVHQTLLEDVGCTDNDFVLSKMLVPYFSGPEIALHSTAETFDAVIQVSFQNGGLLKDERHGGDLYRGQQRYLGR